MRSKPFIYAFRANAEEKLKIDTALEALDIAPNDLIRKAVFDYIETKKEQQSQENGL